MEDKLVHYGVDGMHWGIRRYQNYDGTRTALGKRRERWETTDGKKKGPSTKGHSSKHKKGEKQNSNQGNSNNSNSSPFSRVTSSLRDITKSFKNISESSERNWKNKQKVETAEKNKEPLSKMSNTEIRAAIDRMKLENEYNSLSTKDFSLGHKQTQEVLTKVGDVLAIAASAAAIYSAISNAKKKND